MNQLVEDYLAYRNGELNDPNGTQGNTLANKVLKACDYANNPEGLQKWLMNLKLYSLEREALEAEKRANQ